MEQRNIIIGEIPDDWSVKTLDELVNINKESRDTRKKSPQSNFLYIDIESIGNESGIINSSKEILGKDAPSRARRVVHENDIIMSTVRPYLKAFAIVPKEYENQICSTGFAVLSSKGDLVPKYLLYSLFSNSVINQCNRMMIGGQYPALNTSQVKKIKIPVPSIPEQRKIVEILSTTDHAIQKSDEIIVKTERLKKGMMQKLLTRGIGHDEFKDTPIGRIPASWDLKLLRETVENDSDIVAGPFGSNLKVSDYRSEGVPIIRLQNIERYRFVEKDIKYTSAQKAEELKYHSYEPGDIVLAKLGDPIGKTCLIPLNMESGLIVADVVRIRTSPQANNNFIMYALNSSAVLYQLKKETIGSTRPRVNISQIRNIQIPLPPLLEQEKIAEILSTIDERHLVEIKRRLGLQKVKNGLMNDLLTGRKRVQVSN